MGRQGRRGGVDEIGIWELSTQGEGNGIQQDVGRGVVIVLEEWVRVKLEIKTSVRSKICM